MFVKNNANCIKLLLWQYLLCICIFSPLFDKILLPWRYSLNCNCSCPVHFSVKMGVHFSIKIYTPVPFNDAYKYLSDKEDTSLDNSGMGAKEKEAIGKTNLGFDPSVSSNLARNSQGKTRDQPLVIR